MLSMSYCSATICNVVRCVGNKGVTAFALLAQSCRDVYSRDDLIAAPRTKRDVSVRRVQPFIQGTKGLPTTESSRLEQNDTEMYGSARTQGHTFFERSVHIRSGLAVRRVQVRLLRD
jgi:hypothetical protein